MTFNEFQKVIDIYESHGYEAKSFCEKCGCFVVYHFKEHVVCQGCDAPITLVPIISRANSMQPTEEEKLLMFELLLEGRAAPRMYRNFYRCPHCGQTWADVWDCQCDDDCPYCGKRHVEPQSWEDA